MSLSRRDIWREAWRMVVGIGAVLFAVLAHTILAALIWGNL